MKEISKVFFEKTYKRIKRGDFKEHINIPFMSDTLILSSIKKKIEEREQNNSNIVLSDREIVNIINDVKETAAYTYLIFKEIGLIK